MPTSSQNIDSAYGLNKVARDLAAAGRESTLRNSLRLDPPYPWYALPFDPLFYGTPEELSPQDVQDYG